MTVFVLYLVVGVLLAPAACRHAYRRIRSSHPHTHPRDVRYDVDRAVRRAALVAVLWLPFGLLVGVRRGVTLLGVAAVGRVTVGRHLAAARQEMWEAELATTPDPEEFVVRPAIAS